MLVGGPCGKVPWARLPPALPASAASAASEEAHPVHPFTPPWNQHLPSPGLGETVKLQLALGTASHSAAQFWP